MSSESLGVSVVICCHNSSRLLAETLAHLARQQIDPNVPSELLIVDNGSSDGTGETALRLWPMDGPMPIRVVAEPRLGLSNARHRAFQEAKYEFILFVDDDNWLCPDWVQTVFDLMSGQPDIGACGGRSIAVCEVPPPEWFERCSLLYAISPDGWSAGDITTTGRCLWGAGLTVRKSAWRHLVDNQFQSRLTGRTGRNATSGEDTELCLALRLGGWRLWYEPKLELRHFLPAGRLSWAYLRRIHRGSGAASVALDPYYFASTEGHWSSEVSWSWQAAICCKRLLWDPKSLLVTLFSGGEGNRSVLRTEEQLGRLQALLSTAGRYALELRTVGESKVRWARAVSRA